MMTISLLTGHCRLQLQNPSLWIEKGGFINGQWTAGGNDGTFEVTSESESIPSVSTCPTCVTKNSPDSGTVQTREMARCSVPCPR